MGSFYAGNAIPYGGHIRPTFVLVRGLILSALSCWIGGLLADSELLELPRQLPLLLLALIWRHCHRYKTSFVSYTHAVPQSWVQVVKALASASASVAHISNTLPTQLVLPLSHSTAVPQSVSKSLARCLVLVLALALGLSALSLALSTCVHQHLVSREIHSRLVII